MILFGPVAEAAHGGKSSPAFDLCVGFVVLAVTWVGLWRRQERTPLNIWIAVGISAICFVFICSGIRVLLR
jgi:CHASE2 domain-containing sensor protein